MTLQCGQKFLRRFLFGFIASAPSSDEVDDGFAFCWFGLDSASFSMTAATSRVSVASAPPPTGMAPLTCVSPPGGVVSLVSCMGCAAAAPPTGVAPLTSPPGGVVSLVSCMGCSAAAPPTGVAPLTSPPGGVASLVSCVGCAAAPPPTGAAPLVGVGVTSLASLVGGVEPPVSCGCGAAAAPLGEGASPTAAGWGGQLGGASPPDVACELSGVCRSLLCSISYRTDVASS